MARKKKGGLPNWPIIDHGYILYHHSINILQQHLFNSLCIDEMVTPTFIQWHYYITDLSQHIPDTHVGRQLLRDLYINQ